MPKRVERFEDQLIEDCKQSLGRQRRNLEEARKRLVNLKVSWSYEPPQAMLLNIIGTMALGDRVVEYRMARSKDLVGKAQNIVFGCGIPTVAPINVVKCKARG